MPNRIQASLPAAWQVATSAHFASASVATQIAGVIGSWRWSTSKRSLASTLFSLNGTLGVRTRFGSEPFAGTITVRPSGITSGRGSPWRPWRGSSAPVNLPGGSLPMMIRTSIPRARSASAWSSACSRTAPQKDHENGTTMPTFMREEPSAVGRYARFVFEDGLAELHTHLGGSVASEILWSIAHEQGIALPVKDFWQFDALVTVSDPHGVQGLDELDQIYHWTELIQSSPLAVERSVHGAIGGAYRSQRITTLELRFNPMKRNRGGERDLDHIILAAIRGVDLASIEYPQVRAGLILMMDRTFDARLNEIIVEKAIRWASRGVVGVDIAGPRPDGGRYHYTQVAPMVETAREAGLGVTIHVGEEGGDIGREEIGEMLEVLRPDRIGHGILAAGDEELMAMLRRSE